MQENRFNTVPASGGRKLDLYLPKPGVPAKRVFHSGPKAVSGKEADSVFNAGRLAWWSTGLGEFVQERVEAVSGPVEEVEKGEWVGGRGGELPEKHCWIDQRAKSKEIADTYPNVVVIGIKFGLAEALEISFLAHPQTKAKIQAPQAPPRQKPPTPPPH